MGSQRHPLAKASDFRLGSTAAASECPGQVRFSPNSGAKADMPARRIRARRRPEQAQQRA